MKKVKSVIIKAYCVKYNFLFLVCVGVTNIEKINSEVLKKCMIEWAYPGEDARDRTPLLAVN